MASRGKAAADMVTAVRIRLGFSGWNALTTCARRENRARVRAVGSEVRTRLSVEERREQLLVLGQRLFSERAFAEISVDEIADAASISKGLLYHYFPSKRELYVACAERAAEDILAASEAPRELPREQRLWVSLNGFIGYIEENKLLFSRLLQGGDNGDADLDAVLNSMRRRFVDRTAADLGVDNPGPSTRMCLLGYVGFASFTCLAWARNPSVSREGLRHMLLSSLTAAVTSAATLAEDAAERERLELTSSFLKGGVRLSRRALHPEREG